MSRIYLFFFWECGSVVDDLNILIPSLALSNKLRNARGIFYAYGKSSSASCAPLIIRDYFRYLRIINTRIILRHTPVLWVHGSSHRASTLNQWELRRRALLRDSNRLVSSEPIEPQGYIKGFYFNPTQLTSAMRPSSVVGIITLDTPASNEASIPLETRGPGHKLLSKMKSRSAIPPRLKPRVLLTQSSLALRADSPLTADLTWHWSAHSVLNNTAAHPDTNRGSEPLDAARTRAVAIPTRECSVKLSSRMLTIRRLIDARRPQYNSDFGLGLGHGGGGKRMYWSSTTGGPTDASARLGPRGVAGAEYGHGRADATHVCAALGSGQRSAGGGEVRTFSHTAAPRTGGRVAKAAAHAHPRAALNVYLHARGAGGDVEQVTENAESRGKHALTTARVIRLPAVVARGAERIVAGDVLGVELDEVCRGMNAHWGPGGGPCAPCGAKLPGCPPPPYGGAPYAPRRRRTRRLVIAIARQIEGYREGDLGGIHREARRRGGRSRAAAAGGAAWGGAVLLVLRHEDKDEDTSVGLRCFREDEEGGRTPWDMFRSLVRSFEVEMKVVENKEGLGRKRERTGIYAGSDGRDSPGVQALYTPSPLGLSEFLRTSSRSQVSVETSSSPP
ncbi:hypothetical protein B0H17DRAFT_1235494 [Mycena rosella]|uniref:Uncharacterized protein n=1 Tax=Mycena rosella TaxID=1033263 RepID=A0AAD7GD76_MYCRO|nr:hypothetical protein B0H17DRAFT_1235494 [Mycena rosella]